MARALVKTIGYGGWKQYDIGSTDLDLLTGSVTLTSSTGRAVYYKDPITGAHRLQFNWSVEVASGTRTGITVSMSGVTFKNLTNYEQACAAYIGTGSQPSIAITQPNTDDILIAHPSTTTTVYGVSGDVELEAKPTWADFDATA